MKWLVLLTVTSLWLAAAGKPQSNEALDDESIRLPGHTRPVNYDVNLTVNIHNGSTPYSARVLIKIAVDIATDVITLHNKGLSVIQLTVTDKNNDEVRSTIELDSARDFLFIRLESLLTVGDEYSVDISFSGAISQGVSGFYKMSYTSVDTDEIR